jgi:uncharacterized protein (TIGR02466 family)
MKENYKFINLFQTFILESKLNLRLETLLEYVYNIYKTDNNGIKKSNFGGWQSNFLNLSNSILEPFLNEISKNSKILLKNYSLDNRNYRIESMWANINKYKDSNHLHHHSGSVISGVFYLKTHKDCGSIVFKHPSEIINFCWKKDEYKEYNQTNGFFYEFQPEDNVLLLFPSWLYHYVNLNLNKEVERVSISFNIV